MGSNGDAVMSDGRWFQMRVAATLKARSPTMTQHIGGIYNSSVEVEQSHRQESMSATQRSSHARYGRAILCNQQKASTAILNWICCGMHNQWRKVLEQRCDVVALPCWTNEPRSSIHHRLQFVKLIACHASQRRIVVIEAYQYQGHHQRLQSLLWDVVDEWCGSDAVRWSSWTQFWKYASLLMRQSRCKYPGRARTDVVASHTAYWLAVCMFQAKMPFDDNKLYCSEVLSILLQNHEGKLQWSICIVVLTVRFLHT